MSVVGSVPTTYVYDMTFSSVSGSYAGQKGKARNVGVIAVALFEEQPENEQQIIVGQAPPPPPPHRRPYNFQGDLDDSARHAGVGAAPAANASRGVAKADKAGRAKESAADDGRSSGGPRRAAKKVAEAPASRPAPMPPSVAPAGGAGGSFAPPSDNYADDEEIAPQPEPRQQRERLGLGTEFGEQRTSAASYTRFVRAPGRPVAIAELRYNDAAGLIALGVPVQPLPDPDELDLRETAEPFPGDHFARPPR